MQYILLLPILCLLASCGKPEPTTSDTDPPTPMPTITETTFGEIPGKGTAQLYTLTNAAGNTVKITNYGGIVTSIIHEGVEMTIGFDELERYLEPYPYYGALIGRYGNRIANARFALDGETFDLVPNEKGHQLHGGTDGFDKQLWSASKEETNDAAALTLTHVSPDGDMGFPGELTVSCVYTWTNDNELRLDYEATTTKNTIVNLTNHTYFNISAADTVTAVLLELNADAYTPVDDQLIPFGQNEPVADTPFDFRRAKPIGRDIAADHPQIALASGYDHNWALNDYDGSLKQFAVLTDPASGRKLYCSTTEPGVQIFTTNFKPGQFRTRGGGPVPIHGGICLETQHFPDSPNQEAFATPRLNAGDTYKTTTVYRFE